MKKVLFTIQEYIGTFLFGSACTFCHTPGKAICKNCLSKIPISETTEHDGIYGIYDYGNRIVSEAIWSLKYKHRKQVAKLLVLKAQHIVDDIISEHLISENLEDLILVPVPQYKRKTHQRGFNQSELIANWIAEILPNSKIEKVLEKTKETLPQSHLSERKQRLSNTTNTMRTKSSLDNKKIYIVVDDVTTTGATFLEAKRALKAGGAKNILCIALAHGYKRR